MKVRGIPKGEGFGIILEQKGEGDVSLWSNLALEQLISFGACQSPVQRREG